MMSAQSSSRMQSVRTLIVVVVLAGAVVLVWLWNSHAVTSINVNQNSNRINSTNSPNNNTPSAQNSNDVSSVNSIATTKEYQNNTFGFSLSIPTSWKTTESSSGTGTDKITNILFDGGSKGLTMIIASTSLDGMFHETFSIHNEKKVTIHGQTAIRSQGASAKDGTKTDLLSFSKSGMLYLLNGSADLIDSVGKTFQFAPTP